MTKAPAKTAARKRKPISAAELGRYLRSLALLNRDPNFGNAELSDALMKLGKAFLDQKSSAFSEVALHIAHTSRTDLFPEEASWEKLTLDEVKRRMQRSSISKTELTLIGIKRFGIAKSRLAKLPREQVLYAIEAAIQHEESLTIISEEAKRGGVQRSS